MNEKNEFEEWACCGCICYCCENGHNTAQPHSAECIRRMEQLMEKAFSDLEKEND